MKDKLLIILGVLIIAVVVVWAFSAQKPQVSFEPALEQELNSMPQADSTSSVPAVENDSTAAIESDLNGVQIEDVDQQLQQIDSDINNL